MAAVCCYFNPCRYRSRFRNYVHFVSQSHLSVPLLTIELAFGDQPFELKGFPNVMQLRTQDVMWQKERLLAIGIQELISRGYDIIAWLDADILFEDPLWPRAVEEALGRAPVCQVFERVTRAHSRSVTHQLHSTARTYQENGFAKPYIGEPGFGWAATSALWSACPLYDRAITGNGDTHMALASYCWPSIKHWENTIKPLRRLPFVTPAMRRDFYGWSSRWGALVRGRLEYARCSIRALYHGSIPNRFYGNREQVLVANSFDPRADIELGQDGCWRWATNKPHLHRVIHEYFSARREDSRT